MPRAPRESLPEIGEVDTQVAACTGTNDPAGERQDARRIAQHRAPDTAMAGGHMEFANVFLCRVIHQPIKLHWAMGRSGHLVAITAMGLAVGMLVVPLDAAPRRLVRVPRSPPVALGARSSATPAVASQNRDQKQPSQTDDATREDETCLARLRAADIRFGIPTMPVAAKVACTIEVPVRLKSITVRARRSDRGSSAGRARRLLPVCGAANGLAWPAPMLKD